MIAKYELNAKYKTTKIELLAAPVRTYSFGIIYWKLEGIKIDRKTIMIKNV